MVLKMVKTKFSHYKRNYDVCANECHKLYIKSAVKTNDITQRLLHAHKWQTVEVSFTKNSDLYLLCMIPNISGLNQFCIFIY